MRNVIFLRQASIESDVKAIYLRQDDYILYLLGHERDVLYYNLLQFKQVVIPKRQQMNRLSDALKKKEKAIGLCDTYFISIKNT